MKKSIFLITCEHASNQLPTVYQRFFQDAEEVLASHEGWDPGALCLANKLSDRLNCELMTYKFSRLLIEVNRSIWHHQLFSRYTRNLSAHDRLYLIETYYSPYRNRVEDQIHQYVNEGYQVTHLSIHSFTPNYFGHLRDVQIGLLFDNYRDSECAYCSELKSILRANSSLNIRDNEPYEGADDGLTTYLRGQFGEDQYLGVELEVSQGIVMNKQVQHLIVESIASLSSVLL